MKKQLLFSITILLVSLSKPGFCQTPTDTTQNTSYIYCELVNTQKSIGTTTTVDVDFGQGSGGFQDNRITDKQTGKIKKFNSIVDALNYMGNDGWELVQMYTVTVDERNVYRWILKKKEMK